MNHPPSTHGPNLHLVPFTQAGSAMRFSINRRDNNRQVGILLITTLDRTARHASLELVITDPGKREQHGAEALQLALQAAFCQQGQHRLTVRVPEYDEATIRLIEQTGFALEARQRQAVFVRGRFWDDLVYGLLETDWQVTVQYESIPLPLEGYC
jgi:RimJ/RimL family protein N-acetyltransferase